MPSAWPLLPLFIATQSHSKTRTNKQASTFPPLNALSSATCWIMRDRRWHRVMRSLDTTHVNCEGYRRWQQAAGMRELFAFGEEICLFDCWHLSCFLFCQRKRQTSGYCKQKILLISKKFGIIFGPAKKKAFYDYDSVSCLQINWISAVEPDWSRRWTPRPNSNVAEPNL